MKKSAHILSLLCAFYAQFSYAIDVDAGDYLPAPNDTHVGLLYLQNAEKDTLYQNQGKLKGDYELVSNITITRYVYYTQLKNFTVAPQILIPFGQVEAKGDLSDLGKVKGLADITLALPIWIVENSQDHIYLGITPYLTIPTGKYNEDASLNLGENRYKLTLQTGYAQKIGLFGLDLTGDVTIYSDNNDYLDNTKLEQDMGYQLQASFSYQMKPSFDLRAGISYLDSGNQEVDNNKVDSFKQSKWWVGSAIQLAPKFNMLTTYGQDIEVENGFKENQRINLRFAYVF